MELIYEGVGKKVYRDGDRLIKSFDETYSKADILNEALNQARVEQTSLNIPKILGVSVVDGKWSVIWEFIEGETLEKMMQDHPEKEDEYLDFFVDLQIRMSKEKVPLLGHLRDKMHAKISASSYPASVRYDLHVRLDGLPRHTKLCHGDFQLIAEMQNQRTRHLCRAISGERLIQLPEGANPGPAVRTFFQLKHSFPILTCDNKPFHAAILEFPASFNGFT